ncbi:MAG: peroxiredoxin-like family protein [Bacteroidales bacterium]
MMKKQVVIIVLLLAIGQQIFAQIPEKAEGISPLLYGEKIPSGVLKTPDGEEHNVSTILQEKPTILLIYRGGWCPYCNTHLAEIQQAESQILELGYQLVAISPDSPKNLKSTDEEHQLNYSLYSDTDGNFLKDLGIIFNAPGKYSDMLSKRSNEKNQGFLPVPSVFVVDTSGTILFEYINPDYKTRISAGLLLAVLKELKNNKL